MCKFSRKKESKINEKEKKMTVKCSGEKKWDWFIAMILCHNSWEADSESKKVEKRKKWKREK